MEVTHKASIKVSLKCISTLVSSENEEFDEQQASWKINCCMKGSWF
jgi:hypothetical protein